VVSKQAWWRLEGLGLVSLQCCRCKAFWSPRVSSWYAVEPEQPTLNLVAYVAQPLCCSFTLGLDCSM
jgi:hypothetical protein